MINPVTMSNSSSQPVVSKYNYPLKGTNLFGEMADFMTESDTTQDDP